MDCNIDNVDMKNIKNIKSNLKKFGLFVVVLNFLYFFSSFEDIDITLYFFEELIALFICGAIAFSFFYLIKLKKWARKFFVLYSYIAVFAFFFTTNISFYSIFGILDFIKIILLIFLHIFFIVYLNSKVVKTAFEIKYNLFIIIKDIIIVIIGIGLIGMFIGMSLSV